MSSAGESERSFAVLRDALASGRFTIAPLSDGTGVLLNLAKAEILSFNETGMLLVEELRKGASSPDALAERLEAEFEIGARDALRDVASFVDSLRRALEAEG